jgi:hypothetical protein
MRKMRTMDMGLGLRNELMERARSSRGLLRAWQTLQPLCLCLAAAGGTAVFGVGCTGLDPDLDNCVVLGVDGCDPPEPPPDGTGGTDGDELPPSLWDCLGEPPAVPPANAMRPPITYVVPIVDFANPPTRPEGLTITSCQGGDFDCEAPVPHMESPVPNQPPAVVAITLPYNFDGYLRLSATNYVTTEYYFGGPLLGALDGGTTIQASAAIPMLRDTTMNGLFGLLRRMRDTNSGVLAVRSIGCDGRPSKDVNVVMDQPTRGFGYTLINNAPVAADPPPSTDQRGVSGYANVSPGGAAVQGYVGDTETAIGRGAFPVRANVVTVGEIRVDGGLYGR